ncbi:MAG: integrase [Chloroflexus sp.]|uniref:tyrosine-type recombinase/integrase n=1 Tax=Chloroflexus sp. TaxID=1904827 RepID=UPI0021DCC828|nr:tyrosine-type recombinase/integrase [Chloroflexus sp.]GIV90866.1 MAG: integrase [Chloroflexus sp.]
MSDVNGFGQQPARTILGELEDFLAELRQEDRLSENTITSYRCDLRTAGLALCQELSTITAHDIQQFLASRKEQPGTTNRRIASLNRFFRWAKERGYVTHNPVEQIGGRLPTEHRPQPIANEHELRALDQAIAAAPQPYRLIFTLLREIGIRTDEVLNLNLGDVILEPGREMLLVRDSKSGSKRMIALTPDAMPRSLRGLRHWVREMDHLPPDTPLFRSSRGTRASYDTLHRRWVAVCRAARLIDVVDGREQPRYTLHHLRHTAATKLVAFYPEQVVRRILGHRDPRSTRRYTELVRNRHHAAERSASLQVTSQREAM